MNIQKFNAGKKVLCWALTVWMALFLSGVPFADVVIMKNGQEARGTILKDSFTVKTAKGESIIPKASIKSVKPFEGELQFTLKDDSPLTGTITDTHIEIQTALYMQKIPLSDIQLILFEEIQQATSVTQPAIAQEVILAAGAMVRVELTHTISSGTAKGGDTLTFRVAEDIRTADNTVVITAGTPAYGVITDVKKRKCAGRGGNLAMEINNTKTVDGQPVRLKFQGKQEGKDKYGATIGLAIAFGLFGLFKRGKNVEIPSGTKFDAYVDYEVKVKVPIKTSLIH